VSRNGVDGSVGGGVGSGGVIVVNGISVDVNGISANVIVNDVIVGVVVVHH
jgi:hypothetical protein